MNQEKKTLYNCLFTNVVILGFTVIVVCVLKNPQDKYFTLGPNDNLQIMSVKIDDWIKYFLLHIYLLLTEVTNVIISDIASPKLNFSVFNPQRKVIHGWNKLELQFIANAFWFINSLKSTFSVLLSISQFDVAVARVIYSEVASIYTVRMLLNEKTFTESKRDDETRDEFNSATELREIKVE